MTSNPHRHECPVCGRVYACYAARHLVGGDGRGDVRPCGSGGNVCVPAGMAAAKEGRR